MSDHDFFASDASRIEFDRYELLRKGYVAPRLDGRAMRTWDAFFGELAAACQFPIYFGRNYAAAADLLTDLEWSPSERGYILCIANSDDVLVDETPDDLRLAVSLVRDAAEYWREGPSGLDIWGRPMTLGRFAAILHSSSEIGAQRFKRWVSAGASLSPARALIND